MTAPHTQAPGVGERTRELAAMIDGAGAGGVLAGIIGAMVAAPMPAVMYRRRCACCLRWLALTFENFNAKKRFSRRANASGSRAPSRAGARRRGS